MITTIKEWKQISEKKSSEPCSSDFRDMMKKYKAEADKFAAISHKAAEDGDKEKADKAMVRAKQAEDNEKKARKSLADALKREKKNENFGNDFTQDDAIEDISYYDLTDGRILIFWQEPFSDMAGETNYMYKYMIAVDKEPNTLKNIYDALNNQTYDDNTLVRYDDVKDFLTPEDRNEHDKDRNDLSSDNTDRSRSFVENKVNESDINMQYEILSVKRESDGKVFKVGDRAVSTIDNDESMIKQFVIIDNKCIVITDRNDCYLTELE